MEEPDPRKPAVWAFLILCCLVFWAIVIHGLALWNS